MKLYCCDKCGSLDVFIDDRGNQKALMCGDCGKWIKWVSKKEIPLVERFIESNQDTVGSNSLKNLSADELKIVKHSLKVHLKECEAFKRRNYGRFTEEEEKKINYKINTIKEALTKLD